MHDKIIGAPRTVVSDTPYWTASSDQILLAQIVKNVEKMTHNGREKFGRSEKKRVRLAEHLVAKEPIQRWASADKCSLYMRAKFFFSDAKYSVMADD